MVAVFSEKGRLGIDELLGAAGGTLAPASGVQAGQHRLPARRGAPWLPLIVAGAVGLLLAVVGAVLVSRRRRPARHAR